MRMFSTVLHLLKFSLTRNRNFARKEKLIYETITALINYNAGVLKTKTPKTPKLENEDPPYFSELQNYDQPVANAT